jgi:hypothetical protein
MWVVLTALRRPYSFVVLALLIAILAALNTPTEIFRASTFRSSAYSGPTTVTRSLSTALKQHASIGVSSVWRNYTCTRIDIIYGGRSSLA